MITEQQIQDAQTKWVNAVIEIGQAAKEKKDAKSLASQILPTLYKDSILFKPTLAYQKRVRKDRVGTLSYFVGGHPDFPEDKGFATKNPWKSVEFLNREHIILADSAYSMGAYRFTDFEGNSVEADFTWVYEQDDQENLIITVHHSSLPAPAT